MSYVKHTWTDRIIEFANRFRLKATAESDVYDLERITGEVTEAGTPITAAWLNEMEEGIEGKADAAHTHSPADINGVLPIEKGGTGANTRTGALDALKALGFRGALYGADLDALYEPGMYFVTGSATGTIVNSPFPNNAFALIVSSETDNDGNIRVQQFAARTSANIFRIRGFVIDENGSVTHRDFEDLLTGSSTAAAAAVAAKLSTARTIRTNLGSTTAASFDGSANVTPGVTGTLPVANGGTGAATKEAALSKLGAEPEITVTPVSIENAFTRDTSKSSAVTGSIKYVGKRVIGYLELTNVVVGSNCQVNVGKMVKNPIVMATIGGQAKRSGVYGCISGYIHSSAGNVFVVTQDSGTYDTILITFDFYCG